MTAITGAEGDIQGTVRTSNTSISSDLDGVLQAYDFHFDPLVPTTDQRLRDALAQFPERENSAPPAVQPWECRIGLSKFQIPPTSINVSKVFKTGSMTGATIRHESSAKFNSGHTETQVQMTLIFSSYEQIWGFDEGVFSIDFDNDPDEKIDEFASSLRGLIAQFRYMPILPLRNDYLNKAHNITAVGMSDLSISTLEEYPHAVAATLTLLKFNHRVYMPMIDHLDQGVHFGRARQLFGRAAWKLTNESKPVVDFGRTGEMNRTTLDDIDYRPSIRTAEDVLSDYYADGVPQEHMYTRHSYQQARSIDFYYPFHSPTDVHLPSIEEIRLEGSEFEEEGRSWWERMLGILNFDTSLEGNEYDRIRRFAESQGYARGRNSEYATLRDWLETNNQSIEFMSSGVLDEYKTQRLNELGIEDGTNQAEELKSEIDTSWLVAMYNRMMEDPSFARALAFDRQQGRDMAIREWEIPMVKLNLDPSVVHIDSVAVNRGNKFAPLQLQMEDEPTYQHIGGKDATVEIQLTIEGSNADEELVKLRTMFETVSGLARLHHGYGALGFLGVSNIISSLAGIRYCNTPEAPIWMGDYSFKELGKVEVGDEVIGWESQPANTRKHGYVERDHLTKSTVTNIMKREAPVVKVTMESGRVIRCTADHQWLQARRKPIPNNDLQDWLMAKLVDDYGFTQTAVGFLRLSEYDPIARTLNFAGKEYKTAKGDYRSGPCSVTLACEDAQLLDAYLEHTRPLLDRSGSEDRLFLGRGGSYLGHKGVSRRLGRIDDEFRAGPPPYSGLCYVKDEPFSRVSDIRDYGPVEVGSTLAHIIDPTPDLEPDLEWVAGWLAGIWDGEGSARFISQSYDHNPDVYNKICWALDLLDIPYTCHPDGVDIVGGRQALVDFINKTGASKFTESTHSGVLNQRFKERDRVVSIEPDGIDEVISLTTTTGNYVAWGYASKNCMPLQFDAETIPDYPQAYAVTIVLTDFDVFQQKREMLSLKQQAELVEAFGKRNPFLRIKQLWGQFSAAPDLPLTVRDDDGAIVGHLDPDFYFRRFSTIDDDLTEYNNPDLNQSDDTVGGPPSSRSNYGDPTPSSAPSGHDDGVHVALGRYEDADEFLTLSSGSMSLSSNNETLINQGRFHDASAADLHREPFVEGLSPASRYMQPNFSGDDPSSQFHAMVQDEKYRDQKGRMVRAFPTYMLWLIDEGGDVAGVKMFDNFYGLQSVLDFSIVQSEDILGDTLVLRISNSYSRLSTQMQEYVDSDRFGGRIINEFTQTLQRTLTGMHEYLADLDSIVLQPGLRVHMRMGCSSNPNRLETVFNGTITDVQYGEVMTVTCQSDAIELGTIVNGTDKEQTTGSEDGSFVGLYMSEPRDLMLSLLTQGTSTTREFVAHMTRGRIFSENRFGIKHFGTILYEPMNQAEHAKVEQRAAKLTEEMSQSQSFGNSVGMVASLVSFSTLELTQSLWENLQARRDLEVFKRNIYPGNGIGVGQYAGGDLGDIGLYNAMDGAEMLTPSTGIDIDEVDGPTYEAGRNPRQVIRDAINEEGLANSLPDKDGQENDFWVPQTYGDLYSSTGNSDVVANLFRYLGITPGDTEDEEIVDEVSFRANTYMKTVWDLFLLCAALLPDYIVAVRPFEHRSTVFYGKPHWLYTSGVVPVTSGTVPDDGPQTVEPNEEAERIREKIKKEADSRDNVETFDNMFSEIARRSHEGKYFLSSPNSSSEEGGSGPLPSLDDTDTGEDVEAGIATAVRAARSAGMSDGHLIKMVAIAGAESRFNPGAVGDQSLTNSTWGPSIGLWQVRSMRSQRGTGNPRDGDRLPEPEFNAWAAQQIFQDQGYRAWSVTHGTPQSNNNHYSRYMNQAREAVQGAGFEGGPPSSRSGNNVDLRQPNVEPLPSLDQIETGDDVTLAEHLFQNGWKEQDIPVNASASGDENVNDPVGEAAARLYSDHRHEDYADEIWNDFREYFTADNEDVRETFKSAPSVDDLSEDEAESVADEVLEDLVEEFKRFCWQNAAARGWIVRVADRRQNVYETILSDVGETAGDVIGLPFLGDFLGGVGSIGGAAFQAGTNIGGAIGEAGRAAGEAIFGDDESDEPESSAGAIEDNDDVADFITQLLGGGDRNSETGFLYDWIVEESDSRLWNFGAVYDAFGAFLAGGSAATLQHMREESSPGRDQGGIMSRAAETLGAGASSVLDTTTQIFESLGTVFTSLISNIRLNMFQLSQGMSMSAQETYRSSIINKVHNDSLYYTAGIDDEGNIENRLLNYVDNPFTRELGEPVVEIREPFQRMHTIGSFQDIISDNITANSSGVPTVVTATSNGKHPVTVHFDKAAPAHFQRETQVDTGLRWDKPEGWLDALGSHMNTLRQIMTGLGMGRASDGVGGDISAKRVASWQLKQHLKDIYSGELIVVGDESIRPHDLIYIADVYEGLSGFVECEQVVHHFTPETGFITSITPNAVVTVNDPARFSFTSHWRGQKNIQQVRNHIRQSLNVPATSVSENESLDIGSVLNQVEDHLENSLQFTGGKSALVSSIVSAMGSGTLSDASGAGLALGAGATGLLFSGGGIPGAIAWRGWEWVRDNLLDQHNCFPPGSLVETRYGLKPIEQVCKGDEVFTHQNRWRSVQETMERPIDEQIYHIELDRLSGSTVQPTSEHPFLVFRKEEIYYKNWKRSQKELDQLIPVWTKASDLRIGDFVVVRGEYEGEGVRPTFDMAKDLPKSHYSVCDNIIKTRNHSAGKTVSRYMYTNDNVMYIIGRYLGDGGIIRSSDDGCPIHGVGYVFNALDHERHAVQETKSILEQEFNLITERKDCHNQNTASLRAFSVPVGRMFKEQFGEGFAGKFIPSWAHDLPRSAKLELLRGLFGADGCVSNTLLRLDVSNRELAYGAFSLLRDIGAVPTITTHMPYSGNRQYKVSVAAHFVSDIAKELRCEADSTYVRNRGFITSGDYTAYRVSSVNPQHYKGYVYNLSVDEDESYVVNNIVAHNCYINYLTHKGQPLDAGLSQTHVSNAVGMQHGFSVIAAGMRLGPIPVLGPDDSPVIRTSDVVQRIQWNEFGPNDAAQEVSMFIEQTKKRVHQLSNIEPEGAPDLEDEIYLGTVSSVVDGKTFEFTVSSQVPHDDLDYNSGTMGGSVMQVQLAGVRVPEDPLRDNRSLRDFTSPYPGTQASHYTTQELEGQTVALRVVVDAGRVDDEGNIQAYVFHNAPEELSGGDRNEFLVGAAGGWPHVSWDSYMDNGQPYTFNWQMVADGFGTVDVEDLRPEVR